MSLASRSRWSGRLAWMRLGSVVFALLALLAGERPASATRYALVIASGSFSNGSPYRKFALQGPRSDARLIASLLLWRFHFAAENIAVVGLSDTDRAEITRNPLRNGGVQATYAAITAGFQWLQSAARNPEDTVVVYYSGHGIQIYNPDPHAPEIDSDALVPYDADGLGGNVIRDYQLKALLAAIPSRRKTLIVDSCFSGGMVRMRGDDDPEGISGPVVSRSLPPPAGGASKGDKTSKTLAASLPPGTVLLSACEQNQRAFEKELLGSEIEKRPPIGVGEFTWAFYSLCCHLQDDLSGEDLRTRIEARLQRRGRVQKPVLLGANDSTAFLAPVKWADGGLHIPIAERSTMEYTLGLGWLSGLRTDSVLHIASGKQSLSLQQVGWFNAHARGSVPATERYLTVQRLP